MRPSTAYTPFWDLNDGNFVLIMPHGLGLVLIWMGRTQGDIVKYEESAFSKRWGFNGGFLWRKAQIWMNNICMKIIGMESENVILQI